MIQDEVEQALTQTKAPTPAPLPMRDYADLQKQVENSLNSKEWEVAIANSIVAGLAKGVAVFSLPLINTQEGSLTDSAAWIRVSKSPVFEDNLKGLVDRSTSLAAEMSGRRVVEASLATEMLAAMSSLERPSRSLAEDEFGVVLTRWTEGEGLRFLVGEPDFKISLSVLSFESGLSNPGGSKASVVEPLRNESPIEEPEKIRA